MSEVKTFCVVNLGYNSSYMVIASGHMSFALSPLMANQYTDDDAAWKAFNVYTNTRSYPNAMIEHYELKRLSKAELDQREHVKKMSELQDRLRLARQEKQAADRALLQAERELKKHCGVPESDPLEFIDPNVMWKAENKPATDPLTLIDDGSRMMGHNA